MDYLRKFLRTYNYKYAWETSFDTFCRFEINKPQFKTLLNEELTYSGIYKYTLYWRHLSTQ